MRPPEPLEADARTALRAAFVAGASYAEPFLQSRFVPIGNRVLEHAGDRG